jgi:hypothetical protein
MNLAGMLFGRGGRIIAMTVMSMALAACNEDGGSAASSAAPGAATAAATTPAATTQSGATSSSQAPTITGVPATAIAVSQTYAFKPAASDPNGDALTFRIQNKPAWATFSTTDGRLQGTPTLANVGTYSGIVISVTDGTNTKALATFAINVTQIATGTATVSWLAPTVNEDGSALTNLAGYRIYYGTSQADLTQFVTIDSVGVLTHMVDNLSPATWYFAVKAFTTNGVESDFSNFATKVIS